MGKTAKNTGPKLNHTKFNLITKNLNSYHNCLSSQILLGFLRRV